MARWNESTIFIGIKGTVMALDRMSGEEIWRSALKGSDFVNVALDGDDLLATTRGEMFCLDPQTGHIKWNNPLKGMGWGLISIAGSDIGPMAEYRRRQEAAQRSAAT